MGSSDLTAESLSEKQVGRGPLELSEIADFAVYAPLRKRQLVAAVLASGVVGSVIDSAVFLWLAFGSIAFIEGQVLGKVWMSAGAAAILLAMRARSNSADKPAVRPVVPLIWR